MLKKLLGEELYNQVSQKLGDKKIDVINNGQWIPKQKFDDVIKEKNEYKSKLEEIMPDAEAMEKKKQELWQMEKELMLKKQNLDCFKDFFNANDTKALEEQIETFKGILGDKFKDNQIDSNYKPDNHKQTDAYAEASKNKDVGGMIGFKMSKIFK